MSEPLTVLGVELAPDPDEPDVLEATTEIGVVRIRDGVEHHGFVWALEMWTANDDLVAEISESAVFHSARRAAEDANVTLRHLRDVIATPLRSEIAAQADQIATLKAVLRDMLVMAYAAGQFVVAVDSGDGVEIKRRRAKYDQAAIALTRARDLVPTPAVEHVSRELSAEDAAEAER